MSADEWILLHQHIYIYIYIYFFFFFLFDVLQVKHGRFTIGGRWLRLLNTIGYIIRYMCHICKAHFG